MAPSYSFVANRNSLKFQKIEYRFQLGKDHQKEVIEKDTEPEAIYYFKIPNFKQWMKLGDRP